MGRMFIGILFTMIGLLHFVREPNFRKIIPMYLPFKKGLVYISGVIEILIGFMLIIKKPSQWTKRLINLFLLAVFPANIYMARKKLPLGDKTLPSWALYARLPLQFVLMWIIKKL